ncbi:MAG TPA: triacylglycerol lipase [Methylibium sp.]
MKRFASVLLGALALCGALLASPAAKADTYTQTQYPIVLVHGLLGFDAIGPVNYWYGIPPALSSGGAAVYVSQESAVNSSVVRGEQLLQELLQLQAAYGYTKFNLIGHSHGGQTVRYVASVRPDLVASVTTVGTPHQGSPVADAIEAGTSATGTTAAVAAVVNALGNFISWVSGGGSLPQDAMGALTSLDTAGAQAFNASYPAGAPTSPCGQGPASVNGVAYYSAGGTSVLTNVFDLSDPLLGLTSLFFGFQSNDGLVGQCSSHWGTVLRDDYPWNHLDEVNQSFGLIGWFAPDPVAFYRAQANRLKLQGL